MSSAVNRSQKFAVEDVSNDDDDEIPHLIDDPDEGENIPAVKSSKSSKPTLPPRAKTAAPQAATQKSTPAKGSNPAASHPPAGDHIALPT